MLEVAGGGDVTGTQEAGARPGEKAATPVELSPYPSELQGKQSYDFSGAD